MKLDDFIHKEESKIWEVADVEWREVKIKEVIKDIKSGFALSKNKRSKITKNDGIPQLRPYNILNWNKVDFENLTYVPSDLDNIEDYFIQEGDVLFNNTNSIELVGRAAFVDKISGHYVYSNHISRIKVKGDSVLSEFLSWALNYLWIKGYFYVYATKWIGQAGVSNSRLKNMKIPLPFRNGKPDLETQKRIVEYIEANFTRIDKILEKKKKELERLDELWESVLDRAFRPGPGEEWREVKFIDAVEILDRYRIPVKKGNRKSGPYPYCGANGVIDFVDRYTHNGEFLLLAEDGGFFGKGEQTAYIMKGKFWANNHVHVLKVKPNINLKFLYYFSIFYDFTPHLRGATRPKLSQTGMKKLKILLPFRNGRPDLEKQREIAEYLDSVYEKIKALRGKIQKQIDELEELKESILEEVFNNNVEK